MSTHARSRDAKTKKTKKRKSSNVYEAGKRKMEKREEKKVFASPPKARYEDVTRWN